MNIVIVGVLVFSVVWMVFTFIALRSNETPRASRLAVKSSIFGMIYAWISLAPSVFRMSQALRIAVSIVGLCFIAMSAVYVRRAFRANAETRAAKR